jgi:hypothetical protein
MGVSRLLEDDEKDATPERGAMNLSRGPQVVSKQQERVAAHWAAWRSHHAAGTGQRTKAAVHNHDRGKRHSDSGCPRPD